MTRKPYTRPTLHRRLLTPALAAMGALLLAACAADDAPDAPTGPARRTVVVYAAAQNTLGRDGYLRADSAEMVEGARSLKSDEQLLLFADDATGARIYRFRRDGGAPERVWSRAGETCSTDPATLAEVLAWCATAYPADEYGLVMWSHASGWVPSTNPPTGTTLSFGIDTGEGGRGDMTADGRLGVQMDIDDIARAIEAAGVKLRYVLFDACLMGGVETAYALRGVCYYNLLRNFCEPYEGNVSGKLGVPLVTVFDMEARETRSTFSETVEQAADDMLAAISCNIQDEDYRFNSDVMRGYLARLYFWAGDYGQDRCLNPTLLSVVKPTGQ